MNIIKFLFFFTLLSGGFSFSRVLPIEFDLGLFGEVRFWLLLLLSIISLIEIFTRSKTARYPFSVWNWITVVSLLHLIVLISVSWSPIPSENYYKVSEVVLVLPVLFLSLYHFGSQPDSSVMFFLKLFYYVAVLLILIGLIMFGKIRGDLLSLGAGGIGMARLLGAGIIAGFCFWFKTNRYLWLSFIPLFLLGMLLSGSRASVLALGVAILFLLFFFNVGKSRWKIWIQFFPVIFLFAWLLSADFSNDAIQQFIGETFFKNHGELDIENIYMADRDIIFSNAIKQFLSSPYFGVGYGGYRGIRGEWYPHNLVLNIAVDTGVLGLGLFILSFLLVVTRWFRPKSEEQVFAVAMALFYLCASLFAGTYYDARYMWFFLLLYMLPNTKVSLPPKYK